MLTTGYTLTATVELPFAEAVARVRDELQAESFGLLCEIDVQATLKAKLGVDFRRYTILGACNPGFAHRALQAEDRIGTMLPCNVVVQEKIDGVEVSAVDPVASMAAIDNPALAGIAAEVRKRLQAVIERL
jgi:uncharacterized protein (DUF302 family)